ncbi:MAG TPA: phosphopantothenoylcysteine decarboxylase [Spirochaetota bacterium]|nr:phosphopantothenoylcysteine decarboxylase [Spirochaetota bacterium]HPJ35357.1 phosphopantothenoylcysteine decarboxylase [Spirochaetota bacterium]
MSLKESKIIVTGGPTREWFDPIRYISNASSGKMGVAIAEEAYNISDNTVFIHGPINEQFVQDRKFRCVRIESTSDLLKAVLDELEEPCVLIMAAAPADYTPIEKSEEKIKKTDGDLIINMKRTPDILRNVAEVKEQKGLNGLYVVGFAAETNDTENYAIGKLVQKNLDMICLNDVSKEGAGFNVDTNIMTLFTRDGTKIELPKMPKEKIAREILKRIDIELTNRG